MHPKTSIKLLCVMFIWAASWIFIKVALRDIPPYTLAFLRFSTAAPVIYALSLAKFGKEKVRITMEEVPTYVLLGLTGVTLLYVTEFKALEYTTAINASILINISVIFIAFFAFFFLGENLGKKEWLGILISFIGVIFVVSNGAVEFLHTNTFIGDILMMISSIFWAVYSIVGKKFLETREPIIVTTYAFIFGAIFLIPFSVYEGLIHIIWKISPIDWIAVFYLSFFCSVFAYIVWYQAIKQENASEVAVFLYLIPLFTALLANIFLKEKITPFLIIGGALIICGVHLAQKK